MPSLAAHHSSNLTKMLLIGDPGTAKTGALASLAKAGYNLRIIDSDNGLDILKHLLADDPEALARVSYVTCTDSYKTVGGKPVVLAPKAWNKAMKFLDHWKDEDQDLGKLSSWTENDVLVIDSLTMLSLQALANVLALNSRQASAPQIQDWGAAMAAIEGLLGKLYSEDTKCNVVVISHITYIGDDEHTTGYPSTLGNKLPPKVGRYFNSVLRTFVRGSGNATKRLIATRSQGNIALKTPNPKIPAELPQDAGLATYFKLVRG